MAGPIDPHGPLERMGRWDDPELADIFGDDPDLYELARTVRASRPVPVVGPHFEPYLRAKLMDAASRELRPRGLGRWLRPRPGFFAGGGAALGVAMIAAVVVTTVMYHPNDSRTVSVRANVAEQHQVDPNDVIRVSFSEAVDHTAIEHNLEIHPATSVQTRWEGTTLVITPLHHLAANTPYTVTIPHTAVKTASGRSAAATDIHITFGTAPTPNSTPSAAPAQPPTLQPQQLGPVNGDSRVLIAPDGSVVATSGQLPSAASPTPGVSGAPSVGLPSAAVGLPGATGNTGRGNRPTPAATASPSPSASASAGAGASPQASAPDLRLLQLATGGPVVLGPAATVAAYSPSGRSLAYLVAHGDVADLVVARADGTRPTVLVHSADASSPLAWSGEDSLLYLSASSQVSSVDLQGRTRPVGGLRIGESQDLAFAPGGQVVYVGPPPSAVPSAAPTGDAAASPSPSDSSTPSPESVGHLVDLATGTIHPLQGIRQLPAFSGNGSTVAWIDESGAVPVVDVMPVDGSAAPTTVPTAAQSGDSLANLALDGSGVRLAYTLAHGDGATPALRVVTVASGDTVAVGDAQPVQSPVLSASGDRIAFLRPTADGVVAAAALIPGTAPTTPAADAVPADAAALLDRFVAAQLGHDLGTLQSLAGGGLSVDTTLTPSGVTRSYVITAALDPASQSVVADVRLVRDPSQASLVASFADETLKLVRPAAGQPFQVTAASISDFAGEPAGPQVVHISTAREQSALVVRIAFDSDLDPSTVTGSVITLSNARGVTLPADVRYDVESRTAVIRVLDAAGGPLTLGVSTALRDVAGQALASGYSTSIHS